MYPTRHGGVFYPPTRIACFVCGSDVPADYPLFTDPGGGKVPHFPFLRHQAPPSGCKSPEETNGVAKSCRVCYSTLMSQWEEYERNGVAQEKRVYWLKRNEVVSPANNPPPVTTPAQTPASDSALDLSSGSRDRDTVKSRSSMTSNMSSSGIGTHYSSVQSEAGGTCPLPSNSQSENLADLTLPDKNATHQVCYVCGDEFKKGTLSYTLAKSVAAKEPFYPSLLCHPRPPKSRPMDSSGRVLTCDECHLHLHKQWLRFESEDIAHADRNYSLRKRDQLSAQDSTIFVCYICALDYHSSCLRLVYARPNPEGEPYYPFIEHQKSPPGASPVSPQGMVQVCLVCYKSIEEKHQSFLKNPPSTVDQQPPPKKRRTNLRPPAVNSDELEVIGGSVAGVPYGDAAYDNDNLPADIMCPLCRRKFSIGSFKLLHTLPPPSGGIPYFPFLGNLHIPDDEKHHLIEEGPKKRVRACRSCTTSLINQWTHFQRDQVPVDERKYSYSSLSSNYRRVASPVPSNGDKERSSKTPSVSDIPIRARSNTLESVGARSNSPRTHGISCHSPSSFSEPAGGTQSINKQSNCTSSSSFYCFLCGLHSELSFSRVLYSTAPAKKAPHFPFMKHHVPKPRAETLRDDGTALVCTFCYHSVMAQWAKYNESKHSTEASQRKYDIHNFSCYVCGITTYRKRIRALRVVDFPFLRHHKIRNKDVITMENGEMVAVCLDCFESLRGQFTEGAKYGIPVDKRQYNWMQIPPPPPEDSHITTPQERLQKVERNTVA